MIERRSFIRGGLAMVGLLSTTMISCGQPANTTPLRVGLIDWTGYEPLHLAESLGFYRQIHIELVYFVDITELLRAYRQKEVEVACMTLGEVLQLSTVIPDQRVIMMTDQSAGSDVILAKPSIKTVSDLKGKRIASDLSALSGYLLVRALEKAGLKLQDIEIVSCSLNDQIDAYKADRFDAAITFDPYQSKLVEAGAKIIFDSRQIPGEIVDLMLTSQSVINQNLGTLKILTEGFFQALDYLNRNPEDAIDRMAKREQISSDQFRKALKLLELSDRRTNLKMLDPDHSPLIKVAQKLSNVMIDKNILSKSVNLDTILTNSIIQSK
jgi:NitT/TauT family transport system substrate-binding protein